MLNILKSDNIYIKDFLLEDLKSFKNFTAYEDIFFTDYNLCFLSEREIKNFKKMIKSKKNKFFSIFLEDILIGYIAIKKFGFFNSNFELSISLDKKYSSKGYGYKALKLFLNYYFEDIKENSIWLNVNSFNNRAIHVYKKLGFEVISEFLGDFEVQDIKNLKVFEEKKENFIIKNNIIYSKIFTMKLDKYTFIERCK